MHLPYVAHVHILETEKVEWEGNGPHSRTEEEEGSKIYTRGAISTNDGKGGVSQVRRRRDGSDIQRKEQIAAVGAAAAAILYNSGVAWREWEEINQC